VLAGIRVLDFGRYIAGPFCGALLADLGADVIRIDKTAGSEDRFTTPVSVDGAIGAGFLQLNRNKRGITLNPRTPGGAGVLKRLVATADVVVANLPPDTLQAMGLDYAALIQCRQDIILTSSTAFGSKGPFANRVGFDGVAQAMSGNLHLTGQPGEPMKNALPYVDFMTGALNTVATLAALQHRARTGEGQHVEGALLASALTVAGGSLLEEAVTGIGRTATGNRGQTSAPSDVFPTRDGWIIVQVVGNPLFERWARLVGEESWLTDPRFASDQSRGEHGELISARMRRWSEVRTSTDAIAELERARVPCGEVLTPAAALLHPQVDAMDLLAEVAYPGMATPYPLTRMPFAMSRHVAETRRPPLLGEHTGEILAELGYPSQAIDQLRSEGAI
jgi:crotonobetainyl-CoA:carnitine CoA-transferase CaiB-like acyl-CoA transferase